MFPVFIIVHGLDLTAGEVAVNAAEILAVKPRPRGGYYQLAFSNGLGMDIKEGPKEVARLVAERVASLGSEDPG